MPRLLPNRPLLTATALVGALAMVPRDTFFSWGLHDSLIVVMPQLDIVVARAGGAFAGDGAGLPATLAPFLQPLAEAAR